MNQITIKIKKSNPKVIGFPFEVYELVEDFNFSIYINRDLEQKIINLDEAFKENGLCSEDVSELGKGLYNALSYGKDGQNVKLTQLLYSQDSDLIIGLQIEKEATLIGRPNCFLTNIPWESMIFAWKDQSRMPSIVRFYPEFPNMNLFPFKNVSKLKILPIVSLPDDWEEHGLDEINKESEKKRVEGALSEFISSNQIELGEWILHASYEKIKKAIIKFKPHIILFIGHGTTKVKTGDETTMEGEYQLVLQADDGRYWPATSQDAVNLFTSDHTPGLIILNTCNSARTFQYKNTSNKNKFSNLSYNLIEGGVPQVIGMLHKVHIKEETFTKFLSVFFSKFLSSYSIDHAMTEYRKNLTFNRGDHAGVLPILYTRNISQVFERPVCNDNEIPNVDTTHLPVPSLRLVGRKNELEQLDNAFNNPDVRIFALIAPAGVGKSALIDEWLLRMQNKNYNGARYIYGWSFYSQGSHSTAISSSLFFQEALHFFGYTDEMPRDDTEKARILTQYLNKQPFLLILDGLEPLQYPLSDRQFEGEFRDSGMKSLFNILRRMVWPEHSLVVASSRQRIYEFCNWKAEYYIETQLETLDDTTGAELLRVLKVRGIKSELESASCKMMGHALGILLLGNLLRTKFDGNIRNLYHLPDLFTASHEGEHALRVMDYYDEKCWASVDAPEKILLRLMGLLDHPMNDQERQILFKNAEIAQPLAEIDKLPTLNRNLEDVGILLPCRGERDIWDCHPLLRTYFGKKFQEKQHELYRQAQRVLFEFYKSKLDSQNDPLNYLKLLNYAVVHGILAGEAIKAWKLFSGLVLKGGSTDEIIKKAIYDQELSIIFSFFQGDWETPIEEISKEPSIVQDLQGLGVFCLQATGRLSKAIQLASDRLKQIENYITNAEIDVFAGFLIEIVKQVSNTLNPQSTKKEESVHEKKSIPIFGYYRLAANHIKIMADIYLSLGRLKEAQEVAQKGVDYIDKAKVVPDQFASHFMLASIYHKQGNLRASLHEFEKARQFQKQLLGIPDLLSIAGFRYCTLLLDRTSNHEELKNQLDKMQYMIEQTKNITESYPIYRYFNNLIIGQILFALHKVEEAQIKIREALEECRKAKRIDFLPEVLLIQTRFFHSQREIDKAVEALNELKDIVIPGKMNLYAVDIALLSGHILLDSGDTLPSNWDSFVRPKEHYAEAKKLIEMTGYHLRDAELDLLAARIALHDNLYDEAKNFLIKARRRIDEIEQFGLLATFYEVQKAYNHNS